MNLRKLDDLCVNTLRLLAVDTVQKANNGHPGTPMDAAPMAYALWDRYLKHNPGDPDTAATTCTSASGNTPWTP